MRNRRRREEHQVKTETQQAEQANEKGEKRQETTRAVDKNKRTNQHPHNKYIDKSIQKK